MTSKQHELKLVAPLGALAPSMADSIIHGFEPQESRLEQTSTTGAVQRIAVCDESGLLAVAHGRVIDLYHTASTTRARTTLLEEQSPGARNVSTDDTTRIHLPFSGQIILEDHLDVPGFNSASNLDVCLSATCVSFAAPGYLLVAIACVSMSDLPGTDTISSTWLCGFRTYARSAASSVQGGLPSLFVHCSFADHLPALKSIKNMIKLSRSVFNSSESGAALIQFVDDPSIGVFRWSERFSDRELSLVKPSAASASITAISVSSNGCWVTVCDGYGALLLLDFRAFSWDMQGGARQVSATSGGKRLELGASYRLGHQVYRDHPLDCVRLEDRVRVSGKEAYGTAMQWCSSDHSLHTSQYLLTGQNDGTISVFRLSRTEVNGEYRHRLATIQVYPAIRSLKQDPIQLITVPEQSADTRRLQFSVVSTTARRRWNLPIERNSKRCKVVWPTLAESLSIPTFQLTSVTLLGWAQIPQISRLACTLTELSSSQQSSPASWLLLLAGNSIHAYGDVDEADMKHDGDVPPAPHVDYNQEESHHRATGGRPSTPPFVAILDEQSTTRHIPVSIQDRYQLPVRRQGRSSFSSDQLPQRPKTTRLTKEDYNKRLSVMVQRVDQLGSNLHSLRKSFQLFTDDVQRHLFLISEQLEQLQLSEKSDDGMLDMNVQR